MGSGHMCQNDSPCMTGRVGSKRLWVSSLQLENPQQPQQEGAMNTQESMPTSLSDHEIRPPWALRSPCEKARGPLRMAGDHCTWFQVGLL